MSTTEIIPCVNDAMLKQTAELAEKVWHEYFSSLLSPDQIDYMVDMFQSERAMLEQVHEHSYGYWQVWHDGQLAGYIGLQFQPEKLFLSKLYLAKEFRHKGIASKMLETVYGQGRTHGYSHVWLTCNKYNAHSLDVYHAKGFETFDSQVTDIGRGYVMDDYWLEKAL